MNDLQKRTWAEINLENLRHNYRAIRATLPEGCRFLGVVKADAYGHGALPVSRLLQAEGADYLAVSCLDEALELRGGGVTMPILILGHTPHEYTSVLIEQNITQTVTCLAKALEYSAEAVNLGKTLKILTIKFMPLLTVRTVLLLVIKFVCRELISGALLTRFWMMISARP